MARNNREKQLGLLGRPAWAVLGQDPTLMVGEAYRQHLVVFLTPSVARRDPSEVR